MNQNAQKEIRESESQHESSKPRKPHEQLYNDVFVAPVQKQLDDLKRKSSPPEDASKFLRNNRHADRDPEISLKFKDGGQAFLDEVEEQDQEE